MSNQLDMDVDYSVSATEYKDEQANCLESQSQRILHLMYHTDGITLDQRIQLEQALATAKLVEAQNGLASYFGHERGGINFHLEFITAELMKMHSQLMAIGNAAEVYSNKSLFSE